MPRHAMSGTSSPSPSPSRSSAASREAVRTLSGTVRALRAGEISSVALTEDAIRSADLYDPLLGSCLARFDETALLAAEQADRELAAGLDRGPLHGIPFGIKDLIAAAEGPTTAQSLVPNPFRDTRHDATVTARLRAAGAVVMGKTTTMEFGCGIPDPAKPFPVPRNPYDPSAWAGGSSSGTASGVAAGLFLAGLGSDTGGSIRMPAAFCGVTGLMPTYGLVPRDGCVPLAPSLDRIGPLARSARDCAAVLDVLAGPPHDGRARWDGGSGWDDAADRPPDLSGLRMGVVHEGHFPPGGDPAVPTAFEAAVGRLTGLGARACAVVLPYRAQTVQATLATAISEGLAHHRGDLIERWNDYFAATRGLLARAAFVSGADYVQAQRVRRAAQRALDALFEEVDIVVCPTASIGAPDLAVLSDAHGHQNDEQVFSMIHTPYWNAVGNPVLAVPIGRTGRGLPLSLQIAGPVGGDHRVLCVGDALQRLTGWHLRVPDLAGTGPGAGRSG
ncbi:amidase [Streptomyces uncialis]|uniref:amidase n=1 Tax=Streptomyces uncialis TaxID=1048205 RepID=UPI0038637184|nr:amidase [Streptomyces uncialis]